MRTPFWLPLLLGFLSAAGPLATDMYLPGMPAIEAEFHAIPGASQITLATWLLGLAFGQVLQGTLSDRFGRRAPLFVGLALYTLAAIGAAMAPNMAALATWRVFGAVGGSAGMVIPRAMVRDFATGNAAVRLMAQLMLVMGVGPILAPTIGGALLGLTGWRGIFWVQAGYGLLAMGLIAAVLPESLPPERRIRGSLLGLLGRWRGIITERGFLTHSLIAGATSLAVFSYLGGAPVVFAFYGLSPVAVGMMFGINGALFIIGTQINGALSHRIGAYRLLGFGIAMFATGGAMVAAAAFTGAFGFWGITLAMAVLLASTGYITPNTPVGALHRHAAHAGSASALLGTLQYGMGAVGGAVVATIADGTARPLGLVVAVAAVIAVAAGRARPAWR
jgi:DHA1 family bicyclomycin/chloramphenicol resistance-like MFS transporter